MSDCFAVLQKTISSLFTTTFFWVLFFVELRYFMAFRAGRAGAGAVIKWQYVNTALIFVLLFIFFLISFENVAYWYIPGESDCEISLRRSEIVWIIPSVFLVSFWGLTLVSYAACAVVGDRACRILIPVLVLRTLVTGFLTWLFIVGLTQTSLWLPVTIYFALFALYYIIRALSR